MNTGALLINLEGTGLSSEEKILLNDTAVAGVLLFAKNYQNPQQLQTLVENIRSVRRDLLICVDQEGGRVQRFRDGFTRLPAARAYGELYQQNKDEALQLVRDAGWLMASELLTCGVDLGLGPVLDLDLGKTDVVGDRSFGSKPEQVVALVKAWIDGVHETGMSTVLKHFPGHGSVDADSHEALPRDDRTFADIEAKDLRPFQSLIEQGIEGVMPAHIVFSQVDDQPAGFSKIWQEDILRNKLGFGGLIISDCLTMEGAASAGSYTTRVDQALKAGCDLLILSDRDGLKEVLEYAKESPVRGVGPSRLLTMNRPEWSVLSESSRYKQTVQQLELLN
ncbi:beta-N-acetylhexosaminidase [Endozoicomonas sp. (ex Bugula neritina AB1)]|nr:beta-N-acetylhexosaminidase [Endozoicomonas sp. (ex Bugula neritina AB1)]